MSFIKNFSFFNYLAILLSIILHTGKADDVQCVKESSTVKEIFDSGIINTINKITNSSSGESSSHNNQTQDLNSSIFHIFHQLTTHIQSHFTQSICIHLWLKCFRGQHEPDITTNNLSISIANVPFNLSSPKSDEGKKLNTNIIKSQMYQCIINSVGINIMFFFTLLFENEVPLLFTFVKHNESVSNIYQNLNLYGYLPFV